MSYELKEIPISSISSDFWEKMTSKMVQVVWHYSDVSIPYRDHECYDVFTKKMPGLKLMLGVTNLIDSLVDDIIESSIKIAVEDFSSYPYYSDIALYLALQEAAEIVHQRVYKMQFDLVVAPEERDLINQQAMELLGPLAEMAGKFNPHKTLLLCVVIEGLLIPTVFNFINDLKDVNIDDIDNLAKQVTTTILAANRLILRDEMLHISGGSALVREMIRRGKISLSDIEEVMDNVRSVVINLIQEVSNSTETLEKYYTILSAMYEVISLTFKGESIEFGSYKCLSFVKAMIPSIDGFFKGSVTSYLNGDVKQIKAPMIE